MSRKTRYSSVSELAADVHGRPFADELDQFLAPRQVVRQLMVQRAVRGLSQQEIAAALGCTQSRISKLESSQDEDVRLGDLQKYAAALHLEVRIVLEEPGRTAADQLKYHALCIERLLAQIQQTAHKPPHSNAAAPPPLQLEVATLAGSVAGASG